MIQSKPFVRKTILTMACIAIAVGCMAACLSGCAGAPEVEGYWQFESMEPDEGRFDGLDETAAADLEAESAMLSVFMSDAVAEFDVDGQFTLYFLGTPYEGTWKAEGGKAVVTMPENDPSSAQGTYEVKDSKLVFHVDGDAGRLSGYTVTFEKSSKDAVDAMMEAVRASEAALAEGEGVEYADGVPVEDYIAEQEELVREFPMPEPDDVVSEDASE